MSDEAKDDGQESPETKSGVQRFGKALAKGVGSTVGTDGSAWFRSLFMQAGAVGIICWVFVVNNDRQWSREVAREASQRDELKAMRDELYKADERTQDSRAKAWAEVRAMREAVQALTLEVARGRGKGTAE